MQESREGGTVERNSYVVLDMLFQYINFFVDPVMCHIDNAYHSLGAARWKTS